MNQTISGDGPARKTTASAGKSVDDYLDSVPKAAHAALAKVRKAIKAAAPQATEGISYRILVFKHNGRPLVGLGATKNHCSFYFMRSPQAVQRRHAAELKDYDFSGATIRFPADKPLPAALVRRFVVARLEETEAGQKK